MANKREVLKVENRVGEWSIVENGKKVGDIHKGHKDYRVYFYNGFVYYRTDLDLAKEVARNGEAGVAPRRVALSKQASLDFTEPKPKKESKRLSDSELTSKIHGLVGTDVRIQKVNVNTFDIRRIVKSTVANRWAERIQKIRGITVVGTEDEIDGSTMTQVVRIVRTQNEASTPHADPKPKAVLRRATGTNWYLDGNWTTN